MLQFLDRPGFLLIALAAILLFGAKRLPDSARSLGRSMRILKAETKGLREDDVTVTQLPTVAPAAPVAQPTPVAAPVAVAQPEPVAAVSQP
jgi:sec-independent protein translocase protein TatA